MAALSRLREKLSLLTKDPICDIEETKSHTILSLDLPNVRVEDLDISTAGKTLFVSANREHKCTTGKEETKIIQCHHQNFFREFSFPILLNAEALQAYYQNGVLRIAVPKTHIMTKHKVVVHNSPIGIFSAPHPKPSIEKGEPIESFSDIDDYDWE